MKKITFNPATKTAFHVFLLVFAMFLLLLFRNPSVFINPQPWAEDMSIFLRQEYNTGFPKTPFTLHAGYMELLPRIIAWIALKFDMSGAMMVMNWAVLLIKLLTFYLIYKSREITSNLIKISLIAYMVLVPFAGEVYNNVTNLQWWLIYLMAIVIIRHETSTSGMIFSSCVLILTGLTGVNSVIFAVPCAYLMLKIRTRDSIIKNSIVIICGLIEFYCLYISGRSGNGTLMYNGGGQLVN